MSLICLALTDKIPFKRVFFHPLIADEKGKKMSKSLNNSIEPKDFFKDYTREKINLILLFSMKEQKYFNLFEEEFKVNKLIKKIKNLINFSFFTEDSNISNKKYNLVKEEV